MSNQDAP
jgi:WD40 repeat protein